MANGINGTVKVLGWCGGIVGFLILIYSNFHVPLVAAITEEKKERIAESRQIQQNIDTAILAQQKTNMDITVVLAEIKSDLKYLVRKEGG